MRYLSQLFVLVIFMFSLSACSGNLSVSEGGREAANAYTSFTQQLRNCQPNASGCDKEAIWNALDAQSKSRFLEAYNALVRIDRIIETYFDPIEHKQMKSKTGTDILVSADLKEFKDLYLYLFKPEALVFNENVDSGLEIMNDTVENANKVIIHTHKNTHNITMIRESDGVWRTTMMLNAINASLEPIFLSEDAMREYAKGNLEAEYRRRVEVRDYFLEEKKLRRQNSARPSKPVEKPAAEEPTPEGSEAES